MRLKKIEIKTIKKSFIETFKSGEIYLFGSRIDYDKRGGDIDLYIIPDTNINLTKKKIDFLVSLKKILGEQKIDVVIDRGKDRVIDKIAKSEGILLCKS